MLPSWLTWSQIEGRLDCHVSYSLRHSFRRIFLSFLDKERFLFLNNLSFSSRVIPFDFMTFFISFFTFNILSAIIPLPFFSNIAIIPPPSLIFNCQCPLISTFLLSTLLNLLSHPTSTAKQNIYKFFSSLCTFLALSLQSVKL